MAFRKIQATNLNSVETSFSDSIMVLNKAGTAGQDVGWLGKTGANTYSGLIKDGDDGLFYLINNVILGSQQVNDVNPASIVKGHLVVDTIEAQNYVGISAGTLTALQDVGGSDTPTTGDMILYDGSTWNYVNYEDEITTRITANNNSLTLNGLSDVGSGDTPTTGDMLLHDGSSWGYVNYEDEINTRITASQNNQTLIGLNDVGFTNDTVANGDFLLYDSSTSKFGFVDFASEVNTYADARIAATNSNHVSFGSSISATAFEGKLYDSIGNVILDNTTGNVGIGGKTASFDVFDGDLHGEVIHPTTGSKVIDMQYSTPIYTGNVIGVLEGVIYNSNGNPVLDNGSISGSPSFGGRVDGDVYVDETFVLPKGTAAQRPSNPVEGQMWFNTDTKMFEGYDGTDWKQLIPSTFVPATP